MDLPRVFRVYGSKSRLTVAEQASRCNIIIWLTTLITYGYKFDFAHTLFSITFSDEYNLKGMITTQEFVDIFDIVKTYLLSMSITKAGNLDVWPFAHKLHLYNTEVTLLTRC